MGVYSYDKNKDELTRVDKGGGGIKDVSADIVSYDNSTSGLSATNVQSAIDEVNSDYKSKLTNPNLLDNPWFTVNQRGFTSVQATTATYTVDRWKTALNANFRLDNGIMELATQGANIAVLQQIHDVNFAKSLYGKTITFSVMTEDGKIYSNSGVCPTDKTTSDNAVAPLGDLLPDSVATAIYFNTSGMVNCQIGVRNNKTLRIKAVKLELGTVSTLANDIAPNYADELRRCQRYFVKFNAISQYIGIANAYTTSSANVMIDLPTSMRAKPSVTFDVTPMLKDGTTDISTTGCVVNNVYQNKLWLYTTGSSGLTIGKTYLFKIPQNIGFSADL